MKLHLDDKGAELADGSDVKHNAKVIAFGYTLTSCASTTAIAALLPATSHLASESCRMRPVCLHEQHMIMSSIAPCWKSAVHLAVELVIKQVFTLASRL